MDPHQLMIQLFELNYLLPHLQIQIGLSLAPDVKSLIFAFYYLIQYLHQLIPFELKPH